MFKIAPYPGQTYPGPYANHHDIRAYFGFGELVERDLPGSPSPGWQRYLTLKTKKLPIAAGGAVEVQLTDGRTTRLLLTDGHASVDGMRGKSSRHRTFAECPDCKQWVPAGRTHQHKCK